MRLYPTWELPLVARGDATPYGKYLGRVSAARHAIGAALGGVVGWVLDRQRGAVVGMALGAALAGPGYETVANSLDLQRGDFAVNG